MKFKFYILLFFSFLLTPLFSQNVVVNGTTLVNSGGAPGNCIAGGYKLKGTAIPSGNCVSLTQSTFDAGAMWICDPIDLNQSFKVYFQANFDAFNSGDGVAFVLQSEGVPEVLGAEGGGLGYSYGNLTGCIPAGNCIIDPSVIVEFDIWDNSADFWNVAVPGLGSINDIGCDHAAILVNGDQTSTGTIAGPSCLLSGGVNVTDGQDHDICIIWDVLNLEYSVYFDSSLVTSYAGDIRTNFVDPTNVSWGFTAGSGGANQNQRVCNVDMITSPVNSTCVCLIPVASYAPNPTEICSGETTAIALSSTLAGTTFDWVATNNPNISGASITSQTGASINETLTNTSTVDQIVNYTVTPAANGCPGPSVIVPVTVHPTPTILGNTTLCLGGFSQLAGSGAPDPTAPWTSSNPAVASIDNFGNLNGGAPGTSDITYLDANGCVTMITVTVNPLDDASFTLVDFCEGSPSPPASITGTPGGTFIYNPNPMDGSTLNSATGSITGGVGGTTYTVQYMSGGNCPTATLQDVTANVVPTVDAGVNADICEGTSITLTGSGANSYIWDNGVTDGVAFIPAIGTVTYNLIGTSVNGCENTDNITITVHPNPTPTIIGSATYCNGSFSTLSTSTNYANYSWTTGANTPTVNVTDVDNPIMVTVTDGFGCTGTSSPFFVTENNFITTSSSITICQGDIAVIHGNNETIAGVYSETFPSQAGCDSTSEVTLIVTPSPIISFSADVTSGCAPLTVTFTNTTTGNLTDCLWTLSDGTILSGCGSVTTTIQDGGLYDVALLTASINGCTRSETYVDYIYVEDPPVAAFGSLSPSVSIFNPNVVFLNNSTGAENYLWDFGDSTATSTEENPSHTYDASPSNYEIQLVAYSSLGCTDTAWYSIIVNEELLFYIPNSFTPNADEFNQYFNAVFTSGHDPYDFNFYIFNRWGEKVWESHDPAVGWDGISNDPLREIVPDGVYTWKIDFKTLLSDERVEIVGHVNVLR